MDALTGRVDAGASGFERSSGTIRLALTERGGRAALTEMFQEGSAKVRVPRRGDGVAEAMILNTSGGLAGGDRFDMAVTVQAGTLVTSTQASERVYKSAGNGAARVRQAFDIGPGARLVHQPQPTILFDDAALYRRTRLVLRGEGARVTYCEGFVLGRAAMGETVRRVALNDRTEVVRDGALQVVDAVRLTDETLSRAERQAGLSGARAFGVAIHAADDAPALIGEVRDELAALGSASLVGGCLVARLLAPTHTALQDGLARVARRLTGLDAPRANRL